jgi:hypothetical protein
VKELTCSPNCDPTRRFFLNNRGGAIPRMGEQVDWYLGPTEGAA